MNDIITKNYLSELTSMVIGAAIDVHRNLGPGLLEQVYQRCLEHELNRRKIYYESQKRVPIAYKEMVLDADLRFDLLIENNLIIEFKAVESLHPVYSAQLLTYMKLLKSLRAFCSTSTVLT